MNAYLYNNISTATTTTVCSTAGILHTIVVNATAAGTVEIRDGGAAGTLIGTLKASVAEGTYIYDVAFNKDLTIITGAAPNISVSYLVAGA